MRKAMRGPITGLNNAAPKYAMHEPVNLHVRYLRRRG
jgi:hypothetical protein